jgi:spore germination cell wall hydrolase CwlJ-like protein
VTPVERDTVIRTLVGEAMGEGEAGQAAVAFVIKTRATYPGKTWWGDTIWDVCHRPLQFSCWNDGAPTLPRMCSLSPYSSTYEALGRVVDRVFGGATDPTFGSDHYKRFDVHPKWAEGRRPVVRIGAHEFYKIGPAG